MTGRSRSLIFQNLLPELAPCWSSRSMCAIPLLRAGCRGIIGPVPPPLWIRVLLYSIVVSLYHSQSGHVNWQSARNSASLSSFVANAISTLHKQNEAICYQIALSVQCQLQLRGQRRRIRLVARRASGLPSRLAGPRCGRRCAARRIELGQFFAVPHFLEIFLIERFDFDQDLRHPIEPLTILGQEPQRRLMRFGHDALHFTVDAAAPPLRCNRAVRPGPCPGRPALPSCRTPAGRASRSCPSAAPCCARSP